MKIGIKAKLIAVSAMALLLAACGQTPNNTPQNEGTVTLSLRLDNTTAQTAELQPQGIPNNPTTGRSIDLDEVRVAITDKDGDPVRFELTGGIYAVSDAGDPYISLTPSNGRAEASLELPSALQPFSFESRGLVDSDLVAFHEIEPRNVSDGSVIEVNLRSVLGESVIVPRYPTTYAAPGQVLDLMLVVMANENDDFPDDYLQVPLGDFGVSFDDVVNATLISESNRGLRVTVADECTTAVTLDSTVTGLRLDGSAIEDDAASTFSTTLECPRNLEADVESPEVTLDYTISNRTATGTADDNFGITGLEIYDGPVLVATLNPEDTNSEVALIEFGINSTEYSAELLVDPIGGLQAVAYDEAGNTGTSSETARPTTIDVEEGGSIQEALDKIADGGTVNLPAGTFTENLDLSGDVTIAGDPNGGTVLNLFGGLTGSSLTTSSATGLSGNTGIEISGPDTTVRISNVTINGPIPNCGSGNPAYGIGVSDGATLYLEDSSVLDIRMAGENLSGNQCGIAVQVGRDADNTTGTAYLSNVNISGFQKGAVVVDGTGSHLSITGGTIIGAGLTEELAQNGIQVSRGASAEIDGVTIENVNFEREGSFDTAGAILLYEPGEHVVVSNNILQNNGYGLKRERQVEGGETQVTNNVFENNTMHIRNSTPNELDVSENVFDGIDPASADLTALLALEDKIDHVLDEYVDSGKSWLPRAEDYGLVRVRDGHIYVTEDSGSIQRGIDAASDYDTVVVGSGWYEVAAEDVVPSANQGRLIQIHKPLTLVGPNEGTPGVGSRQDEAVLVVRSDQAAGYMTAIQVYADDVTIDGLKIQAYNPVEGGAATEGIWVSRSVTSDLEIRNMVIDGAEWSIMVNRGRNNGTAGGFVIENNMIRGPGTTSSQAIYVQAADAQVRNNYVTGAGAALQIQPYGDSLNGRVEENIFEALRYGMWFNYQEHADAFWQFSNNQVTRLSNETSSEIEWNGIRIETFQGGRVEFTDNIIDAGADDPDNDKVYLLRQRNVTDGVVEGIGTLDDLGQIFTSNTFSGFDDFTVTVDDLTELDGLLQLLRPAP